MIQIPQRLRPLRALLIAAVPVLVSAQGSGETRAGDQVPARDLTELDLGVRPSDIAPAIRLREHDNRRVEEYRVNNNLYMLKITPQVGAPYYLVDADGSGDMVWNRGGRRFEKQAPQWTLFSW